MSQQLHFENTSTIVANGNCFKDIRQNRLIDKYKLIQLMIFLPTCYYRYCCNLYQGYIIT